jgi:hypothetical protein
MADGGIEDNRQPRRSKGEWKFIHVMAYVRLPTSPCVGPLVGRRRGQAVPLMADESIVRQRVAVDSPPTSTNFHQFLPLKRKASITED